MTEQRIATPSVLLELREERQVVQDGYRFLDEKRLLLAAEILRQLDEYERLQREYLQLHRAAAAALADAAARHGLQGLQVHPVEELEHAELRQHQRRFLGVRLAQCSLTLPDTAAPAAVDPSPEARHCAQMFRELIHHSAPLAAINGNLERLLAEYRRTERRARALEDVLLPELEQALAEIVVRLEELEQEEAVRVRLNYGKR